jgi:hypothetical protein
MHTTWHLRWICGCDVQCRTITLLYPRNRVIGFVARLGGITCPLQLSATAKLEQCDLSAQRCVVTAPASVGVRAARRSSIHTRAVPSAKSSIAGRTSERIGTPTHRCTASRRQSPPAQRWWRSEDNNKSAARAPARSTQNKQSPRLLDPNRAMASGAYASSHSAVVRPKYPTSRQSFGSNTGGCDSPLRRLHPPVQW